MGYKLRIEGGKSLKNKKKWTVTHSFVLEVGSDGVGAMPEHFEHLGDGPPTVGAGARPVGLGYHVVRGRGAVGGQGGGGAHHRRPGQRAARHAGIWKENN
ncbi:hypothetical protein CEXT_544951 [Caerostris extrusa]|uniref:Uncharacterized protein n=1 Tax=Caerostris extrusa TaxID=172846 RepID=A0AAV4MK02_CAEEX|nr:hypothetical protein CEXT_544951 [Caerostris extrusa]